MTAPERSLAQRRNALQRANAIRTTRARLKADIRAGRRSALTILGKPPEYVATMKVWDLLLAVPKVGRVKANKSLTRCRISPSKTIGGLSQRQRDELVSLLRRPGTGEAERHEARREYQRDYRAMGRQVMHASAGTSGIGGTLKVCGGSIGADRVTTVRGDVTCLACAARLRRMVLSG